MSVRSEIRSQASYKWSNVPIPVKDFIQSFKLPQVVMIHDPIPNRNPQTASNLNLQQPILLYKVYACRKIHGRQLTIDYQGNVSPSGPNLIIPDSYQGWLSMVTKDGRTAGFFSTVGDVSRAEVSMFLVQDAVVGLKPTSIGLSRTVIARGQVLKAIGPFEDLNRQTIASANNGTINQDLMMYLKCLTQQGDHVFLPYSARGRFYCIATPKSHSLNHVYLISNILRVSQLPILVRIVSGTKPPSLTTERGAPIPFTNIIRLEDVRREVIILGCTLVDNEPVLLEINANSDFSFVKSSQSQILQNSAVLQRMCQLCTIKGDRWRQQIRVAHYSVPRTFGPNLLRSKSTSDMSSKSSCHLNASCTQRPMSGIGYIPEHNEYANKSMVPMNFDEELKFKKVWRRGSTFPKKFWMFRKAKKLELGKFNKNGRKDCINTISYARSKNQKYMTVKITTAKGAELLIGGEKVQLEVQRFSHSDDGYVTSHADEESIYHSIC